jgi:riboflavin kinase/FMN adenylyltransferase
MKTLFYDCGDTRLPSSVATIGFFDGVHLGHQHLIGQLMEEARRDQMASVVITFDVHPRQVVDPAFCPQLLMSKDEKLEQLSHTGIDYCVMLHFTSEMAMMDAETFMRQVLRDALHVRKLVIGYDNRFGHDRTDGFDDYVAYGKRWGVDVMSSTSFSIHGTEVSSSLIRKMVSNGDMPAITLMMGRCYRLSGRVVGGHQQGRLLGYPTANILLDEPHKLLPPNGVYAAWVSGEGLGNCRPAVVNIGCRPTFGGGGLTIEAHVIGYEGNLYDHLLRVDLCEYLREERVFTDIDELTAQMGEDVLSAEKALKKMMEKDNYEK